MRRRKRKGKTPFPTPRPSRLTGVQGTWMKKKKNNEGMDVGEKEGGVVWETQGERRGL